jgi:hypothetical protein
VAHAAALALLLGAVLPVAATLAWFAAHGALGGLYEALFVFAPGYTGIGLSVGLLPALVGRAFYEGVVAVAPVLAPGLAALALLPPVHPRETEGVALLAGTSALAFLGVALQAKFFVYHYGGALPLLAILSGFGLGKAFALRRAAPGRTAAALALGAAAWLALPQMRLAETFLVRSRLRATAWMHPARGRAIRDLLYSMGDTRRDTNRRVAAWIARATPPGAPLFVWGFEPSLYTRSGRPPASRYIYNVPQRSAWRREESRAALMRDLERTAPSVVVVVEGDALPWVTGSDLDSRAALEGFPALRAFLAGGYRRAARIDDMDLWLRDAP